MNGEARPNCVMLETLTPGGQWLQAQIPLTSADGIDGRQVYTLTRPAAPEGITPDGWAFVLEWIEWRLNESRLTFAEIENDGAEDIHPTFRFTVLDEFGRHYAYRPLP